MQSSEIRRKFLEFYIKKNHQHHPSSSLIPHNDPTLLFANAGMNQFKDFFTGKLTPTNRRAVTTQKCVRAGGKHNDLENVGFTARHHTFFEMLGNFSFGDYFKKEAIAFAWEFLTTELKLPKEKLYVTVHESDDEAEKIWHEQEGLPMSQIHRLGDKDNFWSMGDLGPCGPCTEIYYDRGPDFAALETLPAIPVLDEGRFVEIWNLVFMQFEQTPEGRINLPKPSVDTGAGLERIAAIMQGVYWNYDTDLFQPIIKKLETMSGKSYQDSKYQASFRVVADHIRSTTMLITDGVIPSNEGRGYVLRRIIRRAVRHMNELGFTKPLLFELVPTVFEILGECFPENVKNSEMAQNFLRIEEEKFRETLSQGLKILSEEMLKVKKEKHTILPGEKAFLLYDSFGFPLDLTEIILQENNLTLDHEGFDHAMQAQRERSRASSHFAQAEDNNIFFEWKEKFGATEFTGYQETKTHAKLLASKTTENYTLAIFDRTPFYGESGGQAGDTGFIGSFKVLNTLKKVDDLIVHYLERCTLSDTDYELSVDTTKRNLTAKNHSATHLLQAALIQTLGAHVKQSGSSVDETRLRFDFTHDKALTSSELQKVSSLVNEQITKGLAVNSQVMSKDEAIKHGAMALFGEKYGDKVRVISMQNFSTELCGGTHVSATNEIGCFVIISESSLASGVRRIEALTSSTALAYLEERSMHLKNLEQYFSLPSSELLGEIKKREKNLLDLKKENEQLKIKVLSGGSTSNALFSQSEKLANNIELVIETIPSDDAKSLRSISDQFVSNNSNQILALFGEGENQIPFILRRTKHHEHIDLSEISKNCIGAFEGRGGGKPDMIMGSGISKNKDAFLNELKKILGAK